MRGRCSVPRRGSPKWLVIPKDVLFFELKGKRNVCSRCSLWPSEKSSPLQQSRSSNAPRANGAWAKKRSPISNWLSPACLVSRREKMPFSSSAPITFLNKVSLPAGSCATGLDPTRIDLRKYREDQSRVPAGSGRESGRWTSSDDGEGTQVPSVTSTYSSSEVMSDVLPDPVRPGQQYAQADRPKWWTPYRLPIFDGGRASGGPGRPNVDSTGRGSGISSGSRAGTALPGLSRYHPTALARLPNICEMRSMPGIRMS
jgi:hypothetical protein